MASRLFASLRSAAARAAQAARALVARVTRRQPQPPAPPRRWNPLSAYDPAWGSIAPSSTATLNYNGGLTSAQNGTALLAAINALTSGAELVVGAGTWTLPSDARIVVTGLVTAPILVRASGAALLVGPASPTTFVLGLGGGVGSPGGDVAVYFTLRGFNISGGLGGVTFGRATNTWLDQCVIHDVGGQGVLMADFNTNNNTVTGCEVYNTAGFGEGIALGSTSPGAIAHHCVIAQNHVHDTRAGSEGDGIELRFGCYANLIAENRVHKTRFPAILFHGTNGAEVNLIERNICYDTLDNVVQAEGGECIFRNNLVLGPCSNKVFDSTHNEATLRNLTVINNTFFAQGGFCVGLFGWNGQAGMVFANNACYSNNPTSSGYALAYTVGYLGGVLSGNVVVGNVPTIPPRGRVVGAGLSDFTSVVSWAQLYSASSAFVPSAGSRLIGAASVNVATYDLNGVARTSPFCAGALEESIVPTISRVVVDPLAAGNFLCSWPQPYLPGDDALAWFVTTSAGTKQVQRDRLTDEVVFCSALVAANSTTFDVFTGTDTAPATGWVAPTLTGLGMTWLGIGGVVHIANFTDTTVQDILRDGHNERVVRRWMHSEVTVADALNTQPVGTKIVGHRVYLHFRADLPDVVEVEVELTNASSSVGTLGRGLPLTFAAGGLFGSFGFTDVTFTVPSGWLYLADAPLADSSTIPGPQGSPVYTSDSHAFPKKMGTQRRFVIYKVATSGAAQAAQDLLEKKGLGRATSAGLRSYHSVRAYGPSKSLLPDLAEGFSSGANTGYAAAKAVALAAFTSINDSVAAGIQGSGFTTGRLGLFHAGGGDAFPGAPGGTDIYPFQGFLQVREWVRYCNLYTRCKMDGSGIYLRNRTTGAPLGTQAFGDAYTSVGVPEASSDPQYLGRQPFPMYTQNDSGYEYRGAYLRFFSGWINPEWPPHFRDQNTDHWYPVAQSLWPTAPRSLLNFRCNYTPILEQKMRQTGVGGNGLPIFASPYPYFESAPFGGDPYGGYTIKDPEDAQHAIRMIAKATVSAWLGGDLLAIDTIAMVDEWFGLHFSEIGHVPVADTGASQYYDGRSLLSMYSRQITTPNTARVSIGRAEGWVCIVAATHFALTSVAARESGYPAKGLKRRVELWHETIRVGALPNGATYKYTLADAQANGQLVNAFGLPTPVYGGTPISTDRRMMQVGLEMPITIFGLFCCGRQLQRYDGDQTVLNAFRGHTALVNLYTNYAQGDVTAFGPIKYAEVWSDAGGPPGVQTPGQLAQRYGLGAGNPGFPNHELMVEMAYRIGGSAATLAVSNHLGHHAAGYPNQTPAQRGLQLLQDGSYRGEWNLGLIPLLLHSPGPDIPSVPVTTIPTIAGSASPNPVLFGATTLLSATVVLGANPTSTGLTVTVDISVTGDVDPVKTMTPIGGNVYTYSLNTAGIPPGRYAFPLKVVDAQGRRGSATMVVSIVEGGEDPRFVSVTSSPQPVAVGGDVTITAYVLGGTSPPSTNLDVTLNAKALGLSGTEALPSVGANTFQGTFAIDLGTVVGSIEMTLSASDDQTRMATGTITIVTYDAPVAGTDLQLVAAVESSPVVAGETVRLFAMVTPATEPISSGISASALLSAFGGEESGVALLDDGNAPDDTAADNIFTVDLDVPADQAPGLYSISISVADAEDRSATSSVSLQIIPPFVSTDPRLIPSASPNPVHQLDRVTLRASVQLGTSPDSTGVVVVADFTALGGSATTPLVDTGVAPDLTADDLIFTCQRFIGPSVAPGTYDIAVTVTDDQDRTASSTISIIVLPAIQQPHPPIPDYPISMSYDTLTPNVARVSEGGSAKVCRYIRDGLNAPLLQANVDALQIDIFDEGGPSPEIAIYSTGLLAGDAQNSDGSEIIKTAVTTDGQAPSRAGYTFEWQCNAATAGLRGGRAYRIQIAITIIDPPLTTVVTVPLACDERYT